MLKETSYKKIYVCKLLRADQRASSVKRLTFEDDDDDYDTTTTTTATTTNTTTTTTTTTNNNNNNNNNVNRPFSRRSSRFIPPHNE
jgi:hypothetical protein